MKQLSGLDATFLYMETPTTYGHVNGLSIYQRPYEGFDAFRAVYERFGSIVGHLEPFRRKLVDVPFGLDHPYWIDDADFDLDYHIREIGLAPPGAADQLAEQVARIIGRPMDRRHPLWEIYVIEGLGDGRWALLSKTHHATIDGAAGVMMMQMFNLPDPDSPWPFEPVEWQGEQPPSDSELLLKTAGQLARNPVKAARLQMRLVRNLAEGMGLEGVGDVLSQGRKLLANSVQRSDEAQAVDRQLGGVSLPALQAPPTPFNHNVGPHRRFAMRSTSLSNIKALKDATGGTVNDIVMAICAGALRNYLLSHDALPDAPLQAMVPVSVRTGEEADPWTNRVSTIFAELPTDCDDPIERVARCRLAMEQAKQQLDLLPADVMIEAPNFTSPALATAAVRLVARMSDRVRLPANVVISNVPGPRHPLYFAGAKLDNYIPVSTISNGVGLNITVHSYEDNLDFGLVADRDLVPDLWDLVDLHVAEIHALFEASGAEWAVPPRPAAARRGAPSTRWVKADSSTAMPKKPAAKKKATVKRATAKKPPAKKKAPAKKAAARKK